MDPALLQRFIFDLVEMLQEALYAVLVQLLFTTLV